MKDYHRRHFGSVVPVRSFIKKIPAPGGAKVFGMSASSRKLAVSIIFQLNLRKFKNDEILNLTKGPTVQFRLEEPAIVAFAQAKRVNLPLVII